jgi:hypothetical protein
MRWKQYFALFAACTALWCTRPAAAESGSTADDERTLRAARVGTDGPALLEFFRKRTVNDIDGSRIEKLIEQLGDDSFGVRQKASAELAALGNVAVPLLRQALNSDDIEVVRRAEKCLQLIKAGSGTTVPLAAARLLRQRKPPGAVAVLLAFLPAADNELVSEEVRTSLVALAVRDGKPDQPLVDALTDKHPVRRAAAAEALCRAGIKGQIPAVRKLLKDPEPTVQFKVALALARAHERDAVPVLIDLLGKLPEGQAWQVEDFLCLLAEDQAPSVSVGDDQGSRQKCRDAWAAWWAKHGRKVDLAKLDRAAPLLGYTLVILLDRNLVMELAADGKTPRWKIDDVRFPLDAQMLPGERVLVAEQQANRVTERTTKGDVKWEKQVDGPLMAQRLRNGNTFMATRTQLIEVDRTGKEVFSYNQPGGEMIMKAQKLRNGDIALVTTGRRFVRLDSSGKELASFHVNVQTSGGRIDVLPNGHVLVAEMTRGKVVEYDRDGKSVWEADAEQPIAAVRLRNGNTLVTSMNQNRAIELDRAGKEVWEYKSDTRVTRAWRR